ncbi:MAG: hypothetical protein HQ490_00860 [Lutibacter sp.]|nr:hypothetical protein [Lutibacter sp.]
MINLKDHLKVALPLYLYPFRISGIGNFGIGVSVFNLLLPLIIFLYVGSFRRIGFKPLPFIVYFIAISIFRNTNLLSAVNLTFSYIFIIYYFDFIKNFKGALRHFFISSFAICIISLLLYLVDIPFGGVFSAATADAEAFLHVPRMNGIFLEPSHAGMILALLFSTLLFIYKKKYIHKYISLTTFILTQSAFGFLLFILVNFRKYFLILGILVAFYLLLNTDLELFIQSSGGVRLYGLFYMIRNFSLGDIIVGHGSAYGIKFFSETIGSDFGLEIFNGFIAELILDVGLLGICIAIIYIPKIGDKIFFMIFLILLLFNFGFTVSLFPYLLAFISVYKLTVSKNIKDRRKQRMIKTLDLKKLM